MQVLETKIFIIKHQTCPFFSHSLFLEGYGLRCVLPGKLSANSGSANDRVLGAESGGNY